MLESSSNVLKQEALTFWFRSKEQLSSFFRLSVLFGVVNGPGPELGWWSPSGCLVLVSSECACIVFGPQSQDRPQSWLEDLRTPQASSWNSHLRVPCFGRLYVSGYQHCLSRQHELNFALQR